MDSRFYKILTECHSVPFDWKENNCGLFVASVYNKLYGIDLASDLRGFYNDEKSAFDFITNLGGWDVILTAKGFKKREKDKIYIGDVVVSENAIGIYDGFKGLFAGGAFRKRSHISQSYYYSKE